jgi:4-amino-4-deoxy-L-arabinose transferase-like glycosyltransferase
LSAGEYLVGAGDLLCVFGLIGAGSWQLVRHRLSYVRGTDRALALATVFTTGVFASHVVPLSLGVLSRASVLITAAVLAGATIHLSRRGGRDDEAEAAAYPESGAPEGKVLRNVALVVPLYACVLALAYLTTVATAAVTHVDFMEFHGPAVAHWIQRGSLWDILSLYPTHHSGYDPNSGEILLLAVALPWRSDFLFRFVDIPFLVVTAMALTSMARHLGAGVATAVLYATLVVFLPVVLLLGLLSAKPDTVLMATFATGALFLLRHSRSGRRGELVVAGLALGLAFGTKWNGIIAVAILLAAWAGGRLLFGTRLVRVARDTAGVTLITLAVGGIWFVRNAVATGNPLFPVNLEIAGNRLLSAPEDLQEKRFGGTLAEYLTDFGSLREHILPPIYHNMLGPAGVFLVLLLLVAAAVAVRTAIRSDGEGVNRQAAVIAAAALLIGIAYLFTPYTAQTFNGVPARAWINVRYGAPALLLAAPLAAWLTARAGRFRLVLLVAVVAAVLEATTRSLHGDFADVPARRAALVATALAVLIATGVAIGWAARRLGAGGRRALVAGSAAVALAGVLTVGYAGQDRFAERRYLAVDPTLAWVQRNAPEDHRIALVGEWPSPEFSPALAMYGSRFRNEVVFLGPDRDGILDEYRRAGDLERAVERERPDYVLVQDRPPRGRSANEVWLREMGFRSVASSPGLVLLGRP